MSRVNSTAEKIVDSMANWGEDAGETLSSKSRWVLRSLIIIGGALGIGCLYFLSMFLIRLFRKNKNAR